MREASAEILDAQRPIRILRSMAWTLEVEKAFFAAGARELPRPEYRIAPEVAPALERLRALQAAADRRQRGRALPARDRRRRWPPPPACCWRWARKDFYYHSVELYGRPASLSSDRRTTNLGLARHFDQVVSGFAPAARRGRRAQHHAPRRRCRILKARFDAFFPGRGIRVVVADGMAAAASASADEIKLNREHRFSPRDLRQIEFHEGQVHVATALNGRAQPVMVFLGVPTPRTTSTQEGLAVLTEFLTASTSLPRVRRISDRVLAIQKAEEGADFLEVYRFFLSRGNDEEAAYDGARRVFRGGVIEGGAPFTKDVCYLDGLLRVTNFLRIALTGGQSRLARELFAGKLAVEDVPLFDRLRAEGLASEPRYVATWANDLSFLTALMGYAAFLGESDLGQRAPPLRRRLRPGRVREPRKAGPL